MSPFREKFGAQERAKPRIDIICARFWLVSALQFGVMKSAIVKSSTKSISIGAFTNFENLSPVLERRYINSSLRTRGFLAHSINGATVFWKDSEAIFIWADSSPIGLNCFRSRLLKSICWRLIPASIGSRILGSRSDSGTRKAQGASAPSGITLVFFDIVNFRTPVLASLFRNRPTRLIGNFAGFCKV